MLTPYICAWEAALQCLVVECIFESGGTLKWLKLSSCSFFSVPADFPVFELPDFQLLMLFVCVYLCRCSEEAVSWCHGLGSEESSDNLAHRQQGQGQWEDGEREEAKKTRQAAAGTGTMGRWRERKQKRPDRLQQGQGQREEGERGSKKD